MAIVAGVGLQRDGKLIDWLHAERDVDRFERRAGDWRIAHRTVVHDLERFDDVVPAPDGLSQARYTEKAMRGQRGQKDYSCEMFGAAKPPLPSAD